MPKNRILSYDIFRGVLLIGMIVFHVVVNLTSFQFNQELFYWVPLGFVLFLGVTLARFLENKNLKKLKLAGKLLAIFMVGNVLNFVNKDIKFQDLLVGNSVMFSFEILLPMCLVILLSIVFGRVKNCKFFLGLLILILMVLSYFDLYSYNLVFTIYGLIGYLMAREFDLDKYVDQKKYIVVSAIFTVVALVITQYWFLDFLILFQVLAMYFLVNFLFKKNCFLAILGKYSLALYVVHIVIIKLYELT